MRATTEHTRYLRKLAAETARERLRRAKLNVRDARASRRVARTRAMEACKQARKDLREWSTTERVRVRLEIARLREQLRLGIEERRARVRQCCGSDRASVRAEADKLVAGTRQQLAELLDERRRERVWTRKGSTSRTTATTSSLSAAEQRAESDHEVEANLSPDQLLIWSKVKAKIKGSARRSRTEAFLEWMAENGSDVARILEAEAVAAEKAAIREEAEARKVVRDVPRAPESKLRRYLATGRDLLGIAGIPLLSPIAAGAGVLARARKERKAAQAAAKPRRRLKLRGGAELRPKAPKAPSKRPSSRPPAAADDLATFAARVVQVAKLPGTSRHGGDRAWLGSIYDEGKPWGGLDLEAFKLRCIEAHRKGLLTLTRADLSSAHNFITTERSEAKYLGASFHFVALDEPIRDTVDGLTAAFMLHEGPNFEDRAHDLLTTTDAELRDFYRRAMDLELADLAETRREIRSLLETGPNARGKARSTPPAPPSVRPAKPTDSRGLEVVPEWKYLRRAPDGAGGWHYLYEVTPRRATRAIEYKPGDHSAVKYDPSEGNGTYTSMGGDRYELHETSEGDGIHVIAKPLKPGQQGAGGWSGGHDLYVGPVNMTARQLHEATRRALSRGGSNPRHYRSRHIASITYQDGARRFSFWTITPDGSYGPTLRGDRTETTWETKAEAASAALLSAAAFAARMKLAAPRESRHFKSPQDAQAEIRRVSDADMQSSLMAGAAEKGPAPERKPKSRTRSMDKRLGVRLTAKQLAALRALRGGERLSVNAFGKQWLKLTQAGYINTDSLHDVQITAKGLRLLEEQEGDSAPPVPF